MAGNPTLVDCCWKPGRAIATGLTLEIAHDLGWDAARVLQNLIAASTSAPGCRRKDPQQASAPAGRVQRPIASGRLIPCRDDRFREGFLRLLTVQG